MLHLRKLNNDLGFTNLYSSVRFSNTKFKLCFAKTYQWPGMYLKMSFMFINIIFKFVLRLWKFINNLEFTKLYPSVRLVSIIFLYYVFHLWKLISPLEFTKFRYFSLNAYCRDCMWEIIFCLSYDPHSIFSTIIS